MKSKWPTVTLSNVSDRITVGIATSTTEHYRTSGVPLIRNLNIKEGRLDTQDLLFITNEFDKKNSTKRLQEGDVVTVRTGFAGISSVVPKEFENAQTFTTLITTPNAQKLNASFLCQHLNSVIGAREFVRLTGDAGRANLNAGALREYTFDLPPLPEQQKIADILGTWDEALEKLDALIAVKDRRKQALMQRLLTGHRRLPGFDQSKGRKIKNRHGDYPSDWSRVKLGDVTIESSVRADTTAGGIVLSCTKHHGLVPSEEYFGKRVYAADTSAYKVARRGEFAYATNHIEEGSIGYQNICDIGLVSPIYTVFKTKGAVDDAYFYRLLKSSLMIHLYRVNTSASVDRRGSLRYGEFAEIKINLPKIPEQRAIAAVLDTADAELRLLRQQRTALDHQKRGLMQQLLTGRIRVAQ